MEPVSHNLTGVSGSIATAVTALFAWVSHPIPALQNAASILAIIIGVMTLINVIRKWNK